jgi:molecular chaperone GrpE
MAAKQKRTEEDPSPRNADDQVPGEDEAAEDAPAREATTDADEAEFSAASEDETPAAESAATEEEELTLEEKLQREREEFEERWLRTLAELDNYRKRSQRELADARRFAVADLLRSLLVVQDDFERALESLTQTEDEQQSLARYRAGVELIYQRFQDVLTEQGVQRIEAQDAEFDPALHEAVQQVASDEVAAGHIVAVVQPGYTWHDMVLRPSRVVVAE